MQSASNATGTLDAELSTQQQKEQQEQALQTRGAQYQDGKVT